MKLALKMLALGGSALFLVLSADALPDDRSSRKQEPICTPTAEKTSECSVLLPQGTTQDSGKTEGKKKRGFLISWLHMAAETQTRQPD